MKTLHIVEASTSTQALTVDQAERFAYLGSVLAGERRWWGSADSDRTSKSVFRLTRLFGGSWRIQVGNVVGVVGLPGLTVVIEPKIGLAHFRHLLARSNGVPRVDASATSLGTAPDLHQLVVEWFVAELDVLFRRGLVRDYVAAEERLPYVRGHVDLLSTSRQWLQGRVVADCEFDDFTEDTPVHRLLAAAVQHALRSAWISDRTRARLAYAARELPDPPVGPLPEVDPDDLPTRYSHYQTSLRYAQDVLSGVGRTLDAGDRRSATFLLNSTAVVEAGIRAVLASGLHPVRVLKTGGRHLLPAFVSVNPDLEIGPPPFTGDVKYKIGDRSWNREDLAQAVLFAAAYKSPHAIITDFVEEDPSHRTLQVGDIKVSRLRWRIGDGAIPADSELSFVTDARERLSPLLDAT